MSSKELISKTHLLAEIPVALIHYGDAEYLKYTLAQAKISNPHSNIYLIGDTDNNHYDFATHHSMKEYMGNSHPLTEIYQHVSPNSYEYELFCIRRWFILRDFMQSNKIDKCLYIDSDVMLYANAIDESAKFNQYEMTLHCGTVAHCNYINNSSALRSFCDFVMKCYRDTDSLNHLRERVNSRNEAGISDMILFNEFASQRPGKIGELSNIMENSTYDQNINFAEHFEMENGIKKIIWVGGKPFGKHIPTNSLVRFNILHFQGNSKTVIKDYFTGALQYLPDNNKWALQPSKEIIP